MSNFIHSTTIYTLKQIEELYIIEVLNYYKNNISKTAKALGIGRMTLYRKLKQFKCIKQEGNGE